MKTARTLTIVLFALAAAFALAEVGKAAALGTAFTYQGRLLDDNTAADGAYDFQFKLYDDPDVVIGKQAGSAVNVPDVDVIDGYFTVELDFGSGVFDGDARWLEIGVRPGEMNDPNGYTPLSPLQAITPAPYALYAKNAGPDADWTVLDNIMYPDAAVTGNVGIGTTKPEAKLDVVGTVNATAFTGDGSGLTGIAGAADADWAISGNNMFPGAAVTGNIGIGTTNPLAKLSVGGDGFAGAGVYGSGSTYGVYGNSTSVGVWGYGAFGVLGSGSTYGVYGIDSDTNAYGRLGYDDWGGYFDGDGYFSGNVGIGTKTPRNELDVEGAVAVGASYSGTNTAPTNGMIIQGKVGIGTTTPQNELDVEGAVAVGASYSGTNTGPTNGMIIQGNVGIGTTGPSQKLHVAGTIYSSSGGFRFPDNSVQTSAASAGAQYWETIGSSIRNTNAGNVGIGIGGAVPTSKLTVGGNIFVKTANGRVITPVLEITGGSDLSEQFDIRPVEQDGVVSPGMIVSIDSENPGKLVVSSEPYDRKVAGIISGAGGIKPGMLMGQKDSIANGANPVALTGRVYCLADASQGAIQPGDLLTTSDIPGHAMKAADYNKAQGAILGKAMTSLENGRGQILVLVTLQ